MGMNRFLAPPASPVTRPGWIDGPARVWGADGGGRAQPYVFSRDIAARPALPRAPQLLREFPCATPRAGFETCFASAAMPDSTDLPTHPSDPVAPVSDSVTRGVFPTAPRRYRAFISYSHADTPWANWLLKKLEGYAVPARFHGRAAPIGEVGPRLAPIFRDRDELPTTSDLGEVIKNALRESATLIVICSPNSAKSRWVLEEIKAFKRLHGEGRVLAFIVAGEPKHEGAADDCFSPALRRTLAPDGELNGPAAEVVAADARPHADGKGTAFVRLVAGLLGVGFDELRQRELQRRQRRLTLITAASVAGMVLTLGLAIAAWRARGEAVLARNDAQRRQESAEGVLGFMLGDFRDELKKVGQLDVLEKVGNKALAYFDTADPRDLTDTALARHAKALTQIGEVKLLQKDVPFAEAEKAFVAAYQRAAELVARHPKDGDMLFERAQAEFWIGNTHYKRGAWAPAGEWFTRYRDSAVALVALNSPNVKWQRELISGRHNLAALDMKRGKLAEARAGFLTEIVEVRQLLAADSGNTDLRYKLTDIDSYLAGLAAKTGDYVEARARYAAQRAGLEKLLELVPNSPQWTYKLADCLMQEAEMLAVSGSLAGARDSVARGKQVIANVLARDPSNRRWLAVSSIAHLREAALEMSLNPAESARVLAEEIQRLEKNMAAEPNDSTAVLRLVTALRLASRQLLESGGLGAAKTAGRALMLSEPLLAEDRANDRLLTEFAHASIIAGRDLARAGNHSGASAHWQRARDLLTPQIVDSNDWLLLDPAARALAYLGRTSESRALIARLQRLGYVPLEPWPAEAATTDSVRNEKPQTKQE
jgi:eukaryotic-like serine/threonine-protein kinase